MRVIHVCAYYAPAFVYGGPVHSLHALCKAQQAFGMEVEVFTTNAAGREQLPAAPDGRMFDEVPVRYFALSSPSRLLGAAGLAQALTTAVRSVDVVHIHGLFNRTVWDAATCLQRAGKPYVLSPRGMLEAPALAHHRWRKAVTWHLKDRRVVHAASLVHATSSFELATLRGYSTGNVIQIANPVPVADVDGSASQTWRASRGIPATAPIVLSLGRLHRIKRLDLVAASFLALKRVVPDVHLVIAGPDEQNLRPELETRLASVRDVVHWTGAVEGRVKQAILSAATLLVQCSDSESFGMSIAEALAAGTPVVVTRTCPWQEIDEWRCGLWVEQSPAAVANAMYTVICDRDLARDFGHAGRRFISERMAPARIAEAWHSVYRDVACVNRAAA
jgi:glycosyltransferase involved in cell wall biosynthesis